MANNNYTLAFYVIETGDNHYDLFNAKTDKKILASESEESVINFLELNSPYHPFLELSEEAPETYSFNVNTGDNNSSNTSEHSLHTNYSTTPWLDDFHNSYSFNSGSYVVGEKDKNKKEPTQLEFNFTYSKDNNKYSEEDHLPYLGDNED